MRIAILSRNESLYSTRRLKEAGEARVIKWTLLTLCIAIWISPAVTLRCVIKV